MINKLKSFKDIDPSLSGPPTEASNGLKFTTSKKADIAKSLPKPSIPSIPDIPSVPSPNIPSLPNTAIPKMSAPNFNPQHFNAGSVTGKSVDRLSGKISDIKNKLTSVAKTVSPGIGAGIGGGLSGATGGAIGGTVGGAVSGGVTGAIGGGVGGGLGAGIGNKLGGNLGAGIGGAAGAIGGVALAKKIKSGIGKRIKTVKIPKPPTTEEINSKINNTIPKV